MKTIQTIFTSVTIAALIIGVALLFFAALTDNLRFFGWGLITVILSVLTLLFEAVFKDLRDK